MPGAVRISLELELRAKKAQQVDSFWICIFGGFSNNQRPFQVRARCRVVGLLLMQQCQQLECSRYLQIGPREVSLLDGQRPFERLFRVGVPVALKVRAREIIQSVGHTWIVTAS